MLKRKAIEVFRDGVNQCEVDYVKKPKLKLETEKSKTTKLNGIIN